MAARGRLRCAHLSVLTVRAPTTTALRAQAVRHTVLTVRAPTTALPALAVLHWHAVLTNRAPTTAVHALAAQLSVLAVVELNPNTLGVHAPLFSPPIQNVIGLLLPRAAIILLLEALGARALLLAVLAGHLRLL